MADGARCWYGILRFAAGMSMVFLSIIKAPAGREKWYREIGGDTIFDVIKLAIAGLSAKTADEQMLLTCSQWLASSLSGIRAMRYWRVACTA